MLEYLPDDIREGLDVARRHQRRRQSRLRVHLGAEVFAVLRFWGGGFALDAARTQNLRGYVDLYDGSRHLRQCLIVASVVENGELICEIKQSTRATDGPALDFWQDEHLPAGFLPRA